MSVLLIPLIELAAAIAFFILWAEDRSRRYLFWWGVAHIALPAAYGAGWLIEHLSLLGPLPTMLLYSICLSLVIVAFLKGGMYFRIGGRYQSLPDRAGLLLAVGLLALYLYTDDIHPPATVVALALMSAYGLIAVMLWHGGDRLEKITAVFFVLRGLAIPYLVFLSRTLSANSYAGVVSSFSSVMAITAALLLMLISFRRNQRELNENLQILSLSHEITTLLQGISSIREIGQRVISTFIERHQWVAGALYEVGGSGTTLHLISTAGDSYATSLMEHFPELQVATTINGAAISSGKIALTHDTETDTRIDPALRQHFTYKKNGTLVVVPLIHDNRPLGTLLLRSDHPRYLTPHEMTLLESVGHVVAMALINARQLAELSFQAAHDSLTGLANRASLHEHIASLAGAEFTLMLFDLDRFKEVNDTLGHGVGDQLLCALAQRLQKTLGGNGTAIFRLGGDEFVVLLPHPLAQGSSRDAAAALLALISAPVVIDDISLRTTASIGVVDTGMHQGDSHELLRCADLAMYEAKQSRSAIACYDAGSDFRIRDKVALLGAVRTALDEQQFVLHYQPQIDLVSGQWCGCEALIRWHHPQRGLLPAAAFMPDVEATDMIQAVTYRVIDMVLADMGHWCNDHSRFNVSINLSARNLYDHNLITYLLARTHEYGIDPARLQLEITETVLMADLQASLHSLQRLHDAGFILALDDFGTGYSSLSYLSRFPIQVVKIDQSFVRQMARDHRSVDIVEATIQLSHKLGYLVVAEGVEEMSEREQLRQLGCDVGQGYLFAKPMPLAVFDVWLGAWLKGTDVDGPTLM